MTAGHLALVQQDAPPVRLAVSEWVELRCSRLLGRHPGRHQDIQEAIAHLAQGCDHGSMCPHLAPVPAVRELAGFHAKYLRRIWVAVRDDARMGGA